jgi:fibronectin-binding autotransporter adhesin
MKPKSIMKLSKSLVILAAASAVGALGSAHAATWYWDADDSTAGFGTAGGTWAAPTDAGAIGWSDDSTGASAIGSVTTNTSDTLYFGTDSLGLASGSVAVSGAVDAGNITFGSQSGAITLSGGTINIGSSVITTNNASNTISSILAGTGSTLTKSGTGTLILTGANTYTGSTTISGGALQIGNGGTTGSLSTSSSIVNNASLIFNRSDTIQQGPGFGFANTITGTGSLVKNGGGTLILGQANSYTGGTIVNSGLLALGNALGSAGSIRGALTINQGAQVNASASQWSLGFGASDSVSSITINGGLLNFSQEGSGAGYAGSSIVLTGGTVGGVSFGWYDGNGNSKTVQTLASSTRSELSGGISLRLSSLGTLTFDVASGSTSDGIDLLVSGAITDNTGGRIVKTGSGKLVLSASNTYAGSTTISGGSLQIGNGGTTGSLSTSSSIVNNSSLIFNRSDSLTQGTNFANTISGTGSLVKNGAGTLTMGQSNSYTGGTIVNSGILALANSDASLNVGSIRGALTINQGAQVNANANSWSFGAGAGALGTATAVTSIAINGGLLNFSNAGNGDGGYIGSSIVLTGGTIGGTSFGWYHANVNYNNTLQTLASDTRSTVSGGISLRLSSSGTLTFDVASGSTSDGIDLLVSGSITNAANGGGGNIVKTGSGRMVLTSTTNTYTGSTTVDQGVLQMGNNTTPNNGPSGTMTLKAGSNLFYNYSGDATPTAPLVFDGDATMGNMSANKVTLWPTGSLSGNGRTLTIDSSGTGALFFLQSSTSTLGQINVVRGTLGQNGTGLPLRNAPMNISSGGSFGTDNVSTINNNITLNGGAGASGAAAQYAGAIWNEGNLDTTYTGTITLASGNSTVNAYGKAITMSGLVTGTGAITKTGGQMLTLANNNDYSGTTTISSGTLQVGNGGSTGSLGSGAVTNNGVLAFNRTTDMTVANAISGTGSLTKNAANTLTLTGTNSYSGATTVAAGKLVVNGSISTSSLTTVNSGATLGGDGTVGALTIDSGGFFSPGNSPGITTVDGNYIQNGSLIAEVTGLTPGITGHDQVVVNGTVTLNGALSLTMSTFTPMNGDLLFILLNDSTDAISGTFTGLAQDAVAYTYGGFDWKISYTANNTGVGTGTFTGGNDIALMAIPEPNVAALIGGFGLLALLRRRR